MSTLRSTVILLTILLTITQFALPVDDLPSLTPEFCDQLTRALPQLSDGTNKIVVTIEFYRETKHNKYAWQQANQRLVNFLGSIGTNLDRSWFSAMTEALTDVYKLCSTKNAISCAADIQLVNEKTGDRLHLCKAIEG